jgi:uncharacterized membrane protein YkoI
MTRKLLVGAVAAGALIVTTGTAFALTSDDAPSTRAAQPTTSTSTSTSTSVSPSATGLSAEDASRIATERVGGTVRETELELEHGRIEWKVDITGADGVRYDVRIDAETGAVTRIDADDRGGGREDCGVGDRSADDRGVAPGVDDHGGRDGGLDDNPGGHDRGGDDHGGRHRGGDDH